MAVIEVVPGTSPIVLGQPHSGTEVPDDIRAALNERGRRLADTDWHIPTLYDGLFEGAAVVRARCSRYVVDVNRPASDESLYPGQNTTGLVPAVDFEGQPIWHEAPDAAEIARRTALYHAPFHAALREALDAARARHGFAILLDCHSIRSTVPFLFEGRLPDLNVGTNSGASCAPVLESAALAACGEDPHYTSVLNGRFKGGWNTRHYGQPNAHVHAVQLEIAQATYLASELAPYAYAPAKAARLRAVLARLADRFQQTFESLRP